MGESSFLKSVKILLLSRKEMLIIWVWVGIVSSLIVGKGFPPLQPVLVSICSFFFLVLAVYLYNDVVDADADRNNSFKKGRPLASGEVRRSDAMKLIYISSILGLSISLLNNLPSFLLSLLYFILFGFYSLPSVHLKKRFLMKESVISSGILIEGLSICYAITGSFSPMVFVGLIVISIFCFTVLPAGFDSTDLEADKLQGVKTLASMMTWRRRMQFAVAGMFIIMTITPFTYINFGYNMLAPFLVVGGCLVFLRYLFPIMMSISPAVDNIDMSVMIKVRKISVAFIFVLTTCIVLGSINLSMFFT